MNDKNSRTYQNLCAASLICAIISIFVCGIGLGVVAVICAVLARKKLKDMNLDPESIQFRMMKAKATRLLIISCAILIINIIVMIVVFPTFYEQMMSVYAQYGLVDSSSVSSSGTSIWG